MEAGSLYRLASLDGRRDDDAPSCGAVELGDADRELERGRATASRSTSCSPSCPSASRRSSTCASSKGSPSPRSPSAIGISQMHVSRLLSRSLETLGTHTAAGS